MNGKNLILNTDAYKHTHWMQLPPGTETIHSYITSRGGMFDEVKFIGLQAFIKEYIEGVVFDQADIDEADKVLKNVFGISYFNKSAWESMLKKYGGKLPLQITAPKEGKVIGTQKALVTLANTDPEFPWLTQFVETTLLRAIWYPTSVGTLGFKIKQKIQKYADAQGTTVNPFHLNCFGARGVSSHESAMLGGLAHITNFLGTDTIEGIQGAMKWYGAKGDIAHSVFASEHSTTTIWGEENEVEAYEYFIEQAPDDGLMSVVIDSYDTMHAVKDLLGGKLKDKILNRKGKFVFRPDSGDPVLMSCLVVEALWEVFGGSEKIGNDGRMYKILNPKVGVIYGDGINIDSIENIMYQLSLRHFSIDNIVFGSGGANLQKLDRDTQKFACKATMAYIAPNEKMNALNRTGWVKIQKKSNSADKVSFSATPKEMKVSGSHGYTTITVPDLPGVEEHELVFLNGELLRDQNFNELRSI